MSAAEGEVVVKHPQDVAVEVIRDCGDRSIAICNHDETVVTVIQEVVNGLLEIRAAAALNLDRFPSFFHTQRLAVNFHIKTDDVNVFHSILEETVDDGGPAQLVGHPQSR